MPRPLRVAIALAVAFVSCSSPSKPDAGPGPGPGGDERYVASDDGTAVLWIPAGATTAENITVTRTAETSAVTYDLQPEGLQFAEPAVLFVRTAGPFPRDLDGGAGVDVLQGSLVNADGRSELVETVRSAVGGNEGTQHGLTAMMVPHFTKAALAAEGDGVTVSLTTIEGQSGFTRSVGSRFMVLLDIRRTRETDQIIYTIEAKDSVRVYGVPSTAVIPPVEVPSGLRHVNTGVFECSGEGPGFVRAMVNVITQGPQGPRRSVLTVGLAGVCVRPEFATALAGVAEQFGIQDDAAIDEAVKQAFAPLNRKPTLPAAPIRALAPPRPSQSGDTQTLSLPCTEDCPLGVPLVGHYRLSMQDPDPTTTRRVLRVDGSQPVSITPPVATWASPRRGEVFDFAFTYTCTAVGTGSLRPTLIKTPELLQVPAETIQPTGLVFVTPFRHTDGKSSLTVKCGKPSNDTRVGATPSRREFKLSDALSRRVLADLREVCLADVRQNASTCPLSEDTTVTRSHEVCTSEEGPSPLSLRTNLQTATARYDSATKTYQVEFSGTGGALAANERLQLIGPGGAVLADVPVPSEPADVTTCIGRPQGWDTDITCPGTDASHVRVRVKFATPAGATPGSYGLTRVVARGGSPVTLLSPEVASQVKAAGWMPVSVDVSYVNAVPNPALLPSAGAVPVFVGFSLNLQDVFTTGTGAGGGQGGGSGSATGGGQSGGGQGGGSTTGGGQGGGSAAGGGQGGGSVTGGGTATDAGQGGGSATGGGSVTGGGTTTDAGQGGGSATGGGSGTGGGQGGGSSDGGVSDGGASDGGGPILFAFDAGPSLWDGGTIVTFGLIDYGLPTYSANGLLGANAAPGTRMSAVCRAPGTAAVTYGTGIYETSSSVCMAAVHAGRISFFTGGPIEIEIRPGPPSFPSSTQNGHFSYFAGNGTGVLKGFVFVP